MGIHLVHDDRTTYCLPFSFTQDSCRSPLKSFLTEISQRHQGALLCCALDQAATTGTVIVYTRRYGLLYWLLWRARPLAEAFLPFRQKKVFFMML